MTQASEAAAGAMRAGRPPLARERRSDRRSGPETQDKARRRTNSRGVMP
ncbi:hypothetical protein A33K_12984 [Burkholderia humptydooensis MSMB43]|uniref:Uncharacterized protein n=1 Tax=Burkholderia humptydooensis MSMB43 TaxID=441157 RepID=A0ABN0GB97_9BURK|nr:hypothetical protein A33K_12984 [Burkholderia humptydooensis MSMB43]